MARKKVFALSALAALMVGPFWAQNAQGQAADGRIQGSWQNLPGSALPSRPGPVPHVTTGIVQPGQTNEAVKPHVTRQPSLFVHPDREFQLTIPAGVAVHQRGPEKHLAMRSPKGFVMNLQTGDRNREVPLDGMLGRLEARYLGGQGPWLRKLSAKQIQIGGLPGLQAIYEGHRAKTRVVIARGQATDFVFTFVAPNDLYAEQGGTFDWMLANFRPAAVDMAGQAAQPAREAGASVVPVRSAATVDSFADGRRSRAEAPSTGPAMHRFVEPGYGFHMDYPMDWTVHKPTAFTASFSGPDGSPAFDAVVSVQNVSPKGAHSSKESAAIAAADLLSALDTTTREMTVLAEGNLAESPGSQFVARYEFSGKTYRKWAVVVPRPSGQIAHIWSYTAPDPSFDAFKPVAETMLRSWTLTR